MSDVLIQVDNIKKYYDSGKGTKAEKKWVKALDDVSLKIRRGELIGVVGESGCGKSTLARCILRLISISSGKVFFNGEDITEYTPRQMRPVRRNMQMVFQNPYSSFNPKKTVWASLAEVGRFYGMSSEEIDERIKELLKYVNMEEPLVKRSPNELSGGQLQRLAIIRALLIRPEFLMADEPVSALDVSVQAQILNILMDLREKEDMTMMFISHELTVVEHISDYVIVMYLGTIVEQGKTKDIFYHPKHPYTRALLDSKPREDPALPKKHIRLKGEIPNAMNVPEGCRFWPRCEYCKAGVCDREVPKEEQIEEGHYVACHRWEEL